MCHEKFHISFGILFKHSESVGCEITGYGKGDIGLEVPSVIPSLPRKR